MPRTGGPYLSIAAVCERTLLEKDEVISLIRVIDRLTVLTTVTAPSGVEVAIPVPPPLPITLVVCFKSGNFRGSLPLAIRIETPSSFRWPDFQMEVLFEGDGDRGSQFVLPMQFPAQDEGLYWFVIELGGEEMTRVPLRVIKQTRSQHVPPQLG
jgi:hypothetical protein